MVSQLKKRRLVKFSIYRSIRERIGYYRYLREVIEYNGGGSGMDVKLIGCGKQRLYRTAAYLRSPYTVHFSPCVINYLLSWKISFTLYHAYSKVGRGNTPFPIPPNSGGIVCWVAELNARLLPWCQSEEMKILNTINKYIFR